MAAILFHSHGIGEFDYSALSPDDLEPIDRLAAERDLQILPTVYLRRDYFPRFAKVVRTFAAAKERNELSNIVGFSVEGPLLGPEGGVPREGRWRPTADEWRELASLGRDGLRYIVIAPDAMDLDDPISADFSFGDLLLELYDHGVRSAVGHFKRADPDLSAARLSAVVDFLHSHYEASPYLVLTDHLFNDMPRVFVNAWRTPEEKARRLPELAAFLAVEWMPSNLAETLGPVPGFLLNAARAGLLTPALNFDGEHVDIEICRRTVDFLGADRVIAMTDDTESSIMAGESLHQVQHSGLWHRADGAISAGSCGYRGQVENMTRAGFSSPEIDTLFLDTPGRALAFTPVRSRDEGRRPVEATGVDCG